MSETTTFTAPQTCALAGVTYRQLDYWIRTGRVRPVDGPCGSGNYREFEQAEAAIATRMGVLVRAGLLPDAAEDVARQLQTYGFAHLGGFRIEAA